MPDLKTERSEVASLNQLVQELIGGSARRNTFTQWELELLLDLQMCQVRKSARPELLRRYLKAVQRHYAEGAQGPLRLAAFLDKENERSRNAAITKSNQMPAEVTAEVTAHALS